MPFSSQVFLFTRPASGDCGDNGASNLTAACNATLASVKISEIYSIPGNPRLGRPSTTVLRELAMFYTGLETFSDLGSGGWTDSLGEQTDEEVAAFFKRRADLQNISLSFAVETSKPYCMVDDSAKPGEQTVSKNLVNFE